MTFPHVKNLCHGPRCVQTEFVSAPCLISATPPQSNCRGSSPAISTVVFAIFVASVAHSNIADAASEVSLEHFLAEYTPAVERIEDAYFRLCISERQRTRPGHRPPGMSDIRLRWFPRGIGRQHRFDLLRADGTVDFAKVSTGSGEFSVKRNDDAKVTPGTPAFHYTRIASSGETAASVKGTIAWIRTPFAPYTVYDTRIDEYLRDPQEHITLTDLTKSNKDGAPTATLSFRQRWRGKTVHGHFVFAPESGWVLLEYQEGPPLGQHINVEYGKAIDGIPMIKKVTCRSTKYGQEPYLVAEVTDVQSGPAPDEMFTTATFGLPDVTQPPTRSWLWLSLGLGGLAIALVLGRAFRHRRFSFARKTCATGGISHDTAFQARL
jgi:hypothetical protein